MVIRNSNVALVEVPTTALFVPRVVSTTTCDVHNARTGMHCFSYEATDRPVWFYGICNHRAKKAGMNGTIRPGSLDRAYRGGGSVG